MRERPLEFFRSPKSLTVFLPVLFLVNLLWFYQLGFHTLMGDDLIRWSQVTKFESVTNAFTHILDSTKYRPVNDLCHYALFTLFSDDIRLFFYFNVLFNFVVVSTLYWLVRRVSGGNSVIAFAVSLLYLTSRFAYFNILQVYGILEAVCLLLLLFTIYGVLAFIPTGKPQWAIVATTGYLLLVFTHERYLLILPFLILAIALFDISTSFLRKVVLILLTSVPFFLNLFLKLVVFKVPVAQRTGSIPLELNISSVLTKMGFGLSKIVGINNGPDYLNGVSFLEQDVITKITSVSIFVFMLVVFALAILGWVKLQGSSKKREIKLFLLWAVLLSCLLFSASIVLDQEQRWLYSPFMVVLIYLAYLVSRMSAGFKVAGYCLLTLLVGVTIYNDICYRSYLSRLYFVRANAIADSFYNKTIGRYGTNIVEKQLYVQKFRDYGWILQGSLFFRPYIEHREVKVTYVDGLDQITAKERESDQSLIYVLNESLQEIVDVKNPDPPVLIRFGPDHVKAAEVFNKQPNGESAIWAEGDTLSPSTVFVLDEIELESAVHADGKSATALVPRRLYEIPGAYKIYFFDKITKKKSDELLFVVKP